MDFGKTMVLTKYIVIEKKNEVYLKVEAEPSIKRDLSEYFSFEMPGFKFTPQYRSRVWDGKIRLFQYASGHIYVGLYPYVLDWAEKNNIQVVDGTKIKDAKIKPKLIDRFLSALKLPHEIRDYQKEAFIHSIQKKRCLLLSPTGSGKSLIIYLILIYNLLRMKDDKSNKILIVVPTTSLVEQLFKDFKDYGYNSFRNVHRIYQGMSKTTSKRVIISTWQSIYQQPKKWFEQFGMVIGDEAHLFKAVSLTKIMNKLENCKYRVGLTGTLDGSKTHKLVLEGVFGNVNKVISTNILQERKQLAQLKIYCLVLQHNNVSNMSYQEEMDYLVHHKGRNKYIRNLCIALKGNTLCLFQFVEKHGKDLRELIAEKAEDKKVFYVHGGVDTDEREYVRQITEKSDNAIIIASYGTFSTGINIRNLHNIVFSSPSKSRIRNLQSIGRGLRLKDNKSDATLYDISDDLGNSNYTLNHFRERLNIYKEEKFNYEIHKIGLKDE